MVLKGGGGLHLLCRAHYPTFGLGVFLSDAADSLYRKAQVHIAKVHTTQELLSADLLITCLHHLPLLCVILSRIIIVGLLL